MKAMVLAAGPGTGLRPLTDAIPKPMVPVLDRPLMAHIVDLCRRQGFHDLIASLHHVPEAIRDHFGSAIEYSYEEEPLGTAGGVRNARDFFGGEPIVVVPGDVVTDIDLNELVERHRSTGGLLTLAAKRVDDTSGHAVVLRGADGRVSGFQDRPHPDEALSHLALCGIYCLEREVFDYFGEADPVDWVGDVFPALLENDVPFHVHEIDDYWNDVGSPVALRAATFDVLRGAVEIEVSRSAPLPEHADVDGDVWIGANCRIGAGVRLIGPVVIGGGATIGDGVALRDSIVLPGTDVPDGQIVIGAIHGQAGIDEKQRG
jgi:mannose-1-phosphate guanylyltransferase/mannose-1-phosphate guanylyltransferase/phosphomannomutase